MHCGNGDLTFSPVGSKILYNRKRADESDAAASKQGDTASPEKRNAGLFRFFRRYCCCYAVRFVCEKKFHFFFQETKGTRAQGGSGFLFRLRPRPRGAGAGALPENCGKLKTFPQSNSTINQAPLYGLDSGASLCSCINPTVQFPRTNCPSPAYTGIRAGSGPKQRKGGWGCCIAWNGRPWARSLPLR